MQDVNKRRWNLFLFLSLDIVTWNSASGGFAYIWQSKWVGIITIKTEGTQIHFLSDVLLAVGSLDLKVPNGNQTTTLHVHHAFLYILRLKETVIGWQSYEVISLFSFLSPLKSTDCVSVAEEHSPQYSRFTAPCLLPRNRKANSIASLSCW